MFFSQNYLSFKTFKQLQGLQVLKNLTQFWPMFPFYTPWKHFWFSVLRGYEMGILAKKHCGNNAEKMP